MSLQPTTNINTQTAVVMPKAAKSGNAEQEFSFWDLLDVVNPLQHIPVVNNIYREVTGDKIGNFARIAGGAVFGGVLGVASGVANAVYAEKHNGQDFGDVALAKLEGKVVAETKPLEVVVKPVPKAERFADVISAKDIIWDKPQPQTAAVKPTPTPEELGKKLAEKIVIAPLPPKQTVAETIPSYTPALIPNAMPKKIELDTALDKPTKVASTQTDISGAMMLALAKYNKMKDVAKN